MTDSKHAASANRWAAGWGLLALTITVLGLFDLLPLLFTLVWVPTAVIVGTLHAVRSDLYCTRTTVTIIGDGEGRP